VAPGLATDLPVLLVLVMSWLLVPVAWAHVATGLGLSALVLVHLRTRRGLARRVLRRPRPDRRSAVVAVVWILLAAAVAVSATGLLRWVGVPPEDTWHGGTGYVLLTAVLMHVWLVRGPLWARLRSRGATWRRS
jgi:hypothetical protein